MKRRNRQCMVLGIGVVLQTMVFNSALFAVDGIVVSAEDCRGGGCTQADMPSGSGYGYPIGSIIRANVVNSVVGSFTTIYPATTSLAIQPRISVDGKKVYFFRTGSGSTTYLTVMNIDGTSVTDLLTFSVAIRFSDQFPDRYASWPAGDSLYYWKPGTSDIYCVRVSNPSQNTLVRSFTPRGDPGGPFLERWFVNSGGNRSLYYNSDCTWPAWSSCANGAEPTGCNHCLSTSGRIQSGWLIAATNAWNAGTGDVVPYPYNATNGQPENGRQLVTDGHSYFEFTDWNWSTNARPKFGIFINDHFNFRHLSYMIGTQKLQAAIGRSYIGDWSEFQRFSCNSDKWILHSPGLGSGGGGGVQILWNWADRQVIVGAFSKVKNGAIYESGDLWVKPPDAYNDGRHYEDIRGNWQVVGSQSTAALPDYMACPGSSNPYECALKFGRLVIMKQSVYTTIASDPAGMAKVIPNFEDSCLVLAKNGSLSVTVTNGNYDPTNPIFGRSPNTVTPSWTITNQNPVGSASLSSASGVTTTLNATSSFSSCSLQVSITVGSTTKSFKKFVSTSSIYTGSPTSIGAPAPSYAEAKVAGVRISSLADGAISIAVPVDVRSVDLFTSNGVLVRRASTGAGSAILPVAGVSRGMHLIRMNHADGTSTTARWCAR